jgi:hypothetical protein
MRIALLLSGLLALSLASGCSRGPKLVVVQGKLTDGGKTVLPSRKDGLTIVFIPVGQAGEGVNTYPTTLNPEDDTYGVYGRDGKSGIPLGKYKVSLNLMSINSTPALERFNQKYEAGKTPIEVDVTGPELDIDLANYKSK